VIIKFTSFEDFKTLIDELSREGYRMYLTKSAYLILHPIVSNRNLDTFVFEGNSEEVQQLIKIWGKVYTIDSIQFENKVGGIE